MSRGRGRVAKYKDNEDVLIQWLAGTARQTYDETGTPREGSVGYLYKRFLKVAEDTPQLVRGIVVPKRVLKAARSAYTGRVCWDSRKMEMLQKHPSDKDAKRKTETHQYHTALLGRVVQVLDQAPFEKAPFEKVRRGEQTMTATVKSPRKSKYLMVRPGMSFSPLQRTIKCP